MGDKLVVAHINLKAALTYHFVLLLCCVLFVQKYKSTFAGLPSDWSCSACHPSSHILCSFFISQKQTHHPRQWPLLRKTNPRSSSLMIPTTKSSSSMIPTTKLTIWLSTHLSIRFYSS